MLLMVYVIVGLLIWTLYQPDKWTRPVVHEMLVVLLWPLVIVLAVYGRFSKE